MELAVFSGHSAGRFGTNGRVLDRVLYLGSYRQTGNDQSLCDVNTQTQQPLVPGGRRISAAINVSITPRLRRQRQRMFSQTVLAAMNSGHIHFASRYKRLYRCQVYS